MQIDEPKNPDPGPPKKGFWGWIAGLFPKQPKLEPTEPETPAVPTETPDEERGEQIEGQKSDSGGQTAVSQSDETAGGTAAATPQAPVGQPTEDVPTAPQPGQSDTPLAGTTDETDAPGALNVEAGGAHDLQEAGVPPEVAVPPSVSAPGLEENEGNPATLTAEPPSGGDAPEEAPADSDEDEEHPPVSPTQ